MLIRVHLPPCPHSYNPHILPHSIPSSSLRGQRSLQMHPSKPPIKTESSVLSNTSMQSGTFIKEQGSKVLLEVSAFILARIEWLGLEAILEDKHFLFQIPGNYTRVRKKQRKSKCCWWEASQSLNPRVPGPPDMPAFFPDKFSFENMEFHPYVIRRLHSIFTTERFAKSTRWVYFSVFHMLTVDSNRSSPLASRYENTIDST